MDNVTLPDGKAVSEYYGIRMPDYASVFAVTPEGKTIVQRAYRHGIGYPSLLMPGGMIQNTENALDAAQRELSEETGFRAPNWRLLGTFVVSAVRGCGNAHFFIAEDAVKVTEPDSDDLELTEVLLLSQEQLANAITEGQFVSLGAITTVLLGTRRLHSNPAPILRKAD